MDMYYKILGLKPGASQLEIKKAYFKLIRQHSPESDPEQFQKIREAYEQLKNAGETSEGPAFPPFAEPWAEKVLEQIEQYRRAGNDEKYRDACEEAFRMFPEELRFLYMTVIAQRKCGNTGKAVKNAEKLVSKDPKNKWFQMELAISYMERGYTQKAYFACEKAYEMGCRNLDFVLLYAMECDEYGQSDRGVEILLEVIRREKKWSREEIPELVQCYIGLFKMNRDAEKSYFGDIIDRFCQAFEQYSIYMKEYILEIIMLLTYASLDDRNGAEESVKAQEIFAMLRKQCSTEDERYMIDTALAEVIYLRIIHDQRIGDTLARAYEAYYNLDDMEPQLRKYALTDVQLCMVEERQEILSQVEIIRQDYPDYYEKLYDFIRKLESEKNLDYLKSSLLKTYNRLEQECGGGGYYEKYPQEKIKQQGVLISDGMDQPYVRDSKKIGRNDPCPCGSGKKYKHCCMNKQV